MTRARLAFVVPRYGNYILGGAEALARGLAECLVRSGYEIEVFTTCATDLLSWRNNQPAGRTVENGVTVERFPIHFPWRRKRYDELHADILAHRPLRVDEQFEWVDKAAHSPLLYQALAQRLSAFEYIFVIPHLFGISHYTAALAPKRTIICPCLHDEPYAYLAPTQLMLRSSHGIMYNTAPEQRLAQQKLDLDHPGARLVGFGAQDQTGDEERFRRATGITDPFVLYAGRLEFSKNVPLLVNHFTRYKAAHPGPLRLVLMGNGDRLRFKHPDVLPIGFVQEQDKFGVYKAARLLCQPSVNESFSIVIMESWLAGVPVLVHRDCAVTRDHVTRSGGGLYFGNYDEFEATLGLLINDSALAARMGVNGQAYARTMYSEAAVLARFEQALEFWRSMPQNQHSG